MTPEQEEAVRRALDALGRESDSATPPAVAARLDAVLEDLTAPRRTAEDTGPTQAGRKGGDELARRRRRRSLVLAAAASVVVLAGTATVVRGLGQSSGQGSSASSASAPQATDAQGGEAQNSARGTDSPRSLASGRPGSPLPGTSLHRATLGRDVQRLLARRPEVLTGAASAGPCATPALERGDRLAAVRLDGRPAVLVVGAGRRAARVYACRRPSAPVASARIPGR